MTDEGFTAFFGVQGALLISNASGAPLVAAVGKAVLSRRPLGEVLAALTSQGMDATPDFAFVMHTAAATRVLVRGAYTASARDGEDEPTSVSGQDVATWVEQLLPLKTPVELTAISGPSIHVPAPFEVLDTFDTQSADPPTVPPAPREDPDAKQEVAPPVEPESEPIQEVLVDHTVSGWHTSHGIAALEEPPALVGPEDPFQHMFGHTEYFGAEAAAVRVAEAEAPVTAAQPVTAVPAPPPLRPPIPAATPAPAGSPPSGLIASVPFAMGTAPPVQPSPMPAAMPAASAPPPAPSDAHTISRAEMLRLAGATPVESVVPAALTVGPQLQAVHCPVGHANNPTSEACRTCRTPILDRTIVLVPRPILGKLRFTDGLVHAVHRPVLLGRQPTSDAWTGGEEPQLLPLPDPEQMLSRTHAELRISEWQLQVVDRGSTNGTFVTLPGRKPQKLREREPLLLAAGSQVNLGGVITFEFEESGS